MKRFQVEKFIKLDEGPTTRLEFEMDFKDSIQRSVLPVNEILKGTQCESLINRLSGYNCIMDALNQVREVLRIFLALPEAQKKEIHGRSQWSYAVIQYCKCYQKNHGWTVTLEPSATIKDEEQKIKDVHKWFMDQRDSFIAHGGKSGAQFSNVFLIRRNEQPYTIDGLFVNTLTAVAPPDDALRDLDHLAEVSLKYVIGHTKTIHRKLFLKLLEAKQNLNSEIYEKYSIDPA